MTRTATKPNQSPDSFIGEATEEQKDKWRKDPKNAAGVFWLKVKNHVIYLRKPSIDTLNFCASQTTAATPHAYFQSMLQECKVGGSDEIMKDAEMFLAAGEALKNRFENTVAELGEL